MAIVMTAEIPASTDMYDALNREMGVTDDNLPRGLIAHYAAPSENGMLIVDVWESKEDFEDFAAERLAPAMEKVTGHSGGGIKPTIVELYNRFTG